MIITKQALPRRTFLRAAGATLALPFLDAMVPALGWADGAARPITPPPDGEKVDHLADKMERAESRQEALLDEGVEESFPASDPVSVKHIT